MTLWVEYADELGTVCEMVDEDGVSFFFGMAYFNDKKIPVANLIAVRTVED